MDIRNSSGHLRTSGSRCPRCGFPMTAEIHWDRRGSKQVLVCVNGTCAYKRDVVARKA